MTDIFFENSKRNEIETNASMFINILLKIEDRLLVYDNFPIEFLPALTYMYAGISPFFLNFISTIFISF